MDILDVFPHISSLFFFLSIGSRAINMNVGGLRFAVTFFGVGWEI